MQLLGVGFSQYDWLPKKADGACFRLASKWAMQTLLGKLPITHSFPREGKRGNPTSVKHTLEKTEDYIAKADQLVTAKASELAVKPKYLSSDLVYDAIYGAEAEIADTWAQSIALRNKKGLEVASLRLARLSNWTPSMRKKHLKQGFAFVYSFHYERQRGCCKAPEDASHSVAFVQIGKDARYFDPNIGEHFFDSTEGANLASTLAAIESEIGRRYLRDGSLEHSVVHVIRPTTLEVIER